MPRKRTVVSSCPSWLFKKLVQGKSESDTSFAGRRNNEYDFPSSIYHYNHLASPKGSRWGHLDPWAHWVDCEGNARPFPPEKKSRKQRVTPIALRKPLASLEDLAVVPDIGCPHPQGHTDPEFDLSSDWANRTPKPLKPTIFQRRKLRYKDRNNERPPKDDNQQPPKETNDQHASRNVELKHPVMDHKDSQICSSKTLDHTSSKNHHRQENYLQGAYSKNTKPQSPCPQVSFPPVPCPIGNYHQDNHLQPNYPQPNHPQHNLLPHGQLLYYQPYQGQQLDYQQSQQYLYQHQQYYSQLPQPQPQPQPQYQYQYQYQPQVANMADYYNHSQSSYFEDAFFPAGSIQEPSFAMNGATFANHQDNISYQPNSYQDPAYAHNLFAVNQDGNSGYQQLDTGSESRGASHDQVALSNQAIAASVNEHTEGENHRSGFNGSYDLSLLSSAFEPLPEDAAVASAATAAGADIPIAQVNLIGYQAPQSIMADNNYGINPYHEWMNPKYAKDVATIDPEVFHAPVVAPALAPLAKAPVLDHGQIQPFAHPNADFGMAQQLQASAPPASFSHPANEVVKPDLEVFKPDLEVFKPDPEVFKPDPALAPARNSDRVNMSRVPNTGLVTFKVKSDSLSRIVTAKRLTAPTPTATATVQRPVQRPSPQTKKGRKRGHNEEDDEYIPASQKRRYKAKPQYIQTSLLTHFTKPK